MRGRGAALSVTLVGGDKVRRVGIYTVSMATAVVSILLGVLYCCTQMQRRGVRADAPACTLFVKQQTTNPIIPL